LDEQVARRDQEFAELLDQFVCVRLVQAWSLDLSLFQFDGDLTWVVFFMNADRTIYGRYGSRSSRDDMKDISVAGLKRAIEGALELHRDYPANKQSLAGKSGAAPQWRTPEEIPALPGPRIRAAAGTHGCIHCHAIPSGEQLSRRAAGGAIPDELLWPYPMPDALGMSLDTKERATVKMVAAHSAAGQAGFRAGDRILRLDGQPMISIADVQWVLHRAAAPGEVTAEVERSGETLSITLPLAAGWRRRGDFSWRESAWPLRQRIAGMNVVAVPAAERSALGLAGETPALRIENFPSDAPERNQAPQRAGLQKGDVIVAVDGKDAPIAETNWLTYLVQHKKPGDKLQLTVLRDGQRKQFELPVP
jgi:hypothetical protein